MFGDRQEGPDKANGQNIDTHFEDISLAGYRLNSDGACATLLRGASKGIPITTSSVLPVIAPEVRAKLLEAYGDPFTVDQIQGAAVRLKARFPKPYAAMHPLKMDPTVNYSAKTRENARFRGLEDFTNVGRHCTVAALGLVPLAELAVATGHLSYEGVERILEGGAGHDINKPYEINSKRRIELENAHLPPEDVKRLIAEFVYSEAAYEARLPKELRIDPALLEMLRGAGSQTGHLSNTNFIVTDKEGKLLPFVKQTNFGGLMINLVDGLLYSTKPAFNKATKEMVWEEPEINIFMSATDRMMAIKFEQIYSWMWSMGVALTADNKLVNEILIGQDGRLSERFERHGERVEVQYAKAKLVGHYAGIQAHLVINSAKLFVQMGLELNDPNMVSLVRESQGGFTADVILARYLNIKVGEKLRGG